MKTTKNNNNPQTATMDESSVPMVLGGLAATSSTGAILGLMVLNMGKVAIGASVAAEGACIAAGSLVACCLWKKSRASSEASQGEKQPLNGPRPGQAPGGAGT